ncbi:MAG: CHASE2 domain-containing protein [Verrucomicrobia bacterium]|nr:CHASE2 domain-containing protein [Verrucomicrobiota bacterium]
MNLESFITTNRARSALGAALTVMVGWQLNWTRVGEWFVERSYDVPMVFSNPEAKTFARVELIEMDEASHSELHQDYGAWDLLLHARLLDHLRHDGADLVVFDIVFLNPAKDVQALNEFTEAIRAQGRVVLAAGMEKVGGRGIRGRRVIPPIDELRRATPHWGPPSAAPGEDLVVRQIHPGAEQKPSMVRVAAALYGAPDPWPSMEPSAGPWMRYYGPGLTLPRVSYFEATNRPPGFYRGKTIFIGGRPSTSWVAEEVDEFLSPWKQSRFPLISGLELNATAYLNLIRRDFLRRPSAAGEFGAITLFGLLFGAGLAWARPFRAAMGALVGVIAVTTVAFALFFGNSLVINWCLVVGAQVPVALGFSLCCRWWQLKREKEWMEAPLVDLWDGLRSQSDPSVAPNATPSTTHSSTLLTEAVPNIPDHHMIRRVGRGAYGDVWLARDALGHFHAVKIVWRDTFDDTVPYEREFRGLQHFTPISRGHPGLVNILHVGRDDSTECFYYVMEAGDDERTGPRIDPAAYTPRNLGRELRRRAPFPLAECVELGTALCDALAFLHQQGLVHRDVKPANIIFVNYRPKLADIGLVTRIVKTGGEASNVGTDGYLPPEGPGAVAGDVYALGKVLRGMTNSPGGGESETPMNVVATNQIGSEWDTLRAIIGKATADLPEDRFVSAQEMKEALLRLQAKS